MNSAILSGSILFLILLGNLGIILDTKRKMQIYPQNPPFRLDDFTKSYKVSSLSNPNHLLDDSEGVWIKWREGKETTDIDLELRLTHFRENEHFVPRKWKDLEIWPCSDSQGILSLLLREAINVDKELRLPDDLEIFREEFRFRNDSIHRIPLSSLIRLEPSFSYPDGIFILVLRMKFEPQENPPCLKKVRIPE